MNSLLSCLAYTPLKAGGYATDTIRETETVPGHGYTVRYVLIEGGEGGSSAATPVVIYASGTNEPFWYSERKCRDLSRLYGVDFVAFYWPGPDSLTKTDEWEAHTQDAKYAAIMAVYHHVFNTLERHNVYVWGRSLGSSVAAYLASEVRLSGVVLEAPIASVVTCGSEWYLSNYPNLKQFMTTWVAPVCDAYSTVQFAQSTKFHGAPTRILCLGSDTLLPPVHSEMIEAALHTEGSVNVVRTVLEGKNHNDKVEFKDYVDAVPWSFFYPDSFNSGDE